VIYRNSWGGELILIQHDADFISAIRRRYFAGKDGHHKWINCLRLYFSGTFSGDQGKPYSRSLPPGATLSPDRLIMRMPTKYSPQLGIAELKQLGHIHSEWNVRKLRELPVKLAEVQEWHAIFELFNTVEFYDGFRDVFVSFFFSHQDLYR
jgi:hypothetical protein